jgi:hypothetical protein
MSKAEILAELEHLRPAELAEVQARLDQIAGQAWLDSGELSEADKTALESALSSYKINPDAGSSWEQVKARIQSRLS